MMEQKSKIQQLVEVLRGRPGAKKMTYAEAKRIVEEGKKHDKPNPDVDSGRSQK